jgi:hypothetical protein
MGSRLRASHKVGNILVGSPHFINKIEEWVYGIENRSERRCWRWFSHQHDFKYECMLGLRLPYTLLTLVEDGSPLSPME